MSDSVKFCTKCNIELPLVEFYVNKHKKSGLDPWCKKCCSLKSLRWRTVNKERHNKISREWHATNKDRDASNAKTRRRLNPVPSRIAAAKWQSLNKDKSSARNRQYQAFKIHRTPSWLTEDHKKQIRRYYNVAKWIQSILSEQIDVDHIIPLKGATVSGLHVPWNLQLLTHSDNCSKYNKVKGSK